MENLVLDEAPTQTLLIPETQSCNSLMSITTAKSNIHPLFVLEKAFGRMKAVGSSTALVAIKNNNQLNVCNLGDSGF